MFKLIIKKLKVTSVTLKIIFLKKDSYLYQKKEGKVKQTKGDGGCVGGGGKKGIM